MLSSRELLVIPAHYDSLPLHTRKTTPTGACESWEPSLGITRAPSTIHLPPSSREPSPRAPPSSHTPQPFSFSRHRYTLRVWKTMDARAVVEGYDHYGSKRISIFASSIPILIMEHTLSQRDVFYKHTESLSPLTSFFPFDPNHSFREWTPGQSCTRLN